MQTFKKLSIVTCLTLMALHHTQSDCMWARTRTGLQNTWNNPRATLGHPPKSVSYSQQLTQNAYESAITENGQNVSSKKLLVNDIAHDIHSISTQGRDITKKTCITTQQINKLTEQLDKIKLEQKNIESIIRKMSKMLKEIPRPKIDE